MVNKPKNKKEFNRQEFSNKEQIFGLICGIVMIALMCYVLVPAQTELNNKLDAECQDLGYEKYYSKPLGEAWCINYSRNGIITKKAMVSSEFYESVRNRE